VTPPDPTPAVDAVLLDLGNVLVFHDDQRLLQRLAELGGGTRTAEAVGKALESVWAPCVLGVLAGSHLRWTVGAAAGATAVDEATFREAWSCHFRVHEEVLPLVESLLGRVKVLLLSNTNAMHIDFLRPRLPILERFDALVLSHELGIAKPDPAIFAEALRRAGTAPERTAYFDDVAAYTDAARALGLQAHQFTTAAHFREQLAALGLAPPPS
jgi:putative hydrolase of the HAD superfamily